MGCENEREIVKIITGTFSTSRIGNGVELMAEDG